MRKHCFLIQFHVELGFGEIDTSIVSQESVFQINDHFFHLFAESLDRIDLFDSIHSLCVTSVHTRAHNKRHLSARLQVHAISLSGCGVVDNAEHIDVSTSAFNGIAKQLNSVLANHIAHISYNRSKLDYSLIQSQLVVTERECESKRQSFAFKIVIFVDRVFQTIG